MINKHKFFSEIDLNELEVSFIIDKKKLVTLNLLKHETAPDFEERCALDIKIEDIHVHADGKFSIPYGTTKFFRIIDYKEIRDLSSAFTPTSPINIKEDD